MRLQGHSQLLVTLDDNAYPLLSNLSVDSVTVLVVRIQSVTLNSCLFFLVTPPKKYFFLFPNDKTFLPSKMAKHL